MIITMNIENNTLDNWGKQYILMICSVNIIQLLINKLGHGKSHHKQKVCTNNMIWDKLKRFLWQLPFGDK